MDSFKVSEVKRMELGGNQAWHDFWDNHPEGGAGSDSARKGVWSGVVVDRYDGPVGEEYKERLACKVEGREFVPLPKKERKAPAQTATGVGSGTSTPNRVGRGSPAPAAALGGGVARTASPALGGARKERNEAYFAKMGAENSSRPDDVPPSQGGKYGGFGSGFVPEGPGKGVGGQGIPGADEFQKDPMAALTKGFGWFTTTVGKGAKNVNDGWIQPGMQKVSRRYCCHSGRIMGITSPARVELTRMQIAESDLAAQARTTATSVAQNVQKGSKNAADSFNTSFQKFVEGSEGTTGAKSTVEPERRDFWDSFGGNASGPAGSSMLAGVASSGSKKGSSIGTSAMKSGGSGGEGKEAWGEDNW